MPHQAKLVAAGLLLVASTTPVVAEFDAASFLATQCTGCHDTGVYTREDRRMTSLPALQAQVERCDANLTTQLFPDDLAAVVDYLNDNYYKFDQ